MFRPIHFEIHADDPERAIRFYNSVFGWSFTKWKEDVSYWVVRTGPDAPGIDGGLLQRRGPPPLPDAGVNAYVCTIDVPDLPAALAKVAAHGGQQVVPTMPIPGVGHLDCCKDTEGTIIGLMQADPAAKL